MSFRLSFSINKNIWEETPGRCSWTIDGISNCPEFDLNGKKQELEGNLFSCCQPFTSSLNITANFKVKWCLTRPGDYRAGRGKLKGNFCRIFHHFEIFQRGAQKNKQKRDYLLLEIALPSRWARSLWITLKTMPRTPGLISVSLNFDISLSQTAFSLFAQLQALDLLTSVNVVLSVV